jgi:hypothetical protein
MADLTVTESCDMLLRHHGTSTAMSTPATPSPRRGEAAPAQKLVQAAIRCFEERGFHGASMSQISEGRRHERRPHLSLLSRQGSADRRDRRSKTGRNLPAHERRGEQGQPDSTRWSRAPATAKSTN